MNLTITMEIEIHGNEFKKAQELLKEQNINIGKQLGNEIRELLKDYDKETYSVRAYTNRGYAFVKIVSKNVKVINEIYDIIFPMLNMKYGS